MPIGLSHILLCTGQRADEVYRTLYLQLKTAGVSSGFTTFAFPDFVRDVVRQRFNIHGKYDNQCVGRPNVYQVTADDLADAYWKPPAEDCFVCSIPMPDTP